MRTEFITYVLYSDKHEQLYIGQTNNLERRLTEHNRGRVESTRPYIPYRLIYKESFTSKEDAVRREKELKKTSGRRMLKKFIQPEWRNW